MARKETFSLDDAQEGALRIRRDGRPPNILMLFSDQHQARMAGFMGHKTVRTPNLDRLATQGAVFDQAYCNSPLCSPSRHSFMAGLWCHEIGAWNNTSTFPEDTVTWAHALSAAGYETSLIGKMHFNSYQKMYGFDRRPVLEGNNRGEQFHSWGVRTSHSWRDPLPYRAGSDGRGMWHEIMEAGPDTPEREPIFAHDLRILQGTLDYLKEKAADPDRQPWAACASFVLPHPPFKARPDILATYKGTGDLPFNLSGAGRDTCDRYIQQFKGDLMNLPEDRIRNGREVYYSLITEFDEYAGRILDALDDSGLAENTVVFYFSDHGEMAGEHGIWGKVTLLESSVRVPMIVRWPGVTRAGTRVATPVSLVDLFPTFLDVAGAQLPPPLYLNGHSLRPLLEGRAEDFGGAFVFGEFEGEGWNHPRCWLRCGRYKYVYNHSADSRLYDIESDYEELHDLSGRPEHAEAERRMRERIFSFWDPERIEREVILRQERGKLARNKNMCKDLGW